MSSNWTETKDPASGRSYWYNAEGKTTWKDPNGVVSAIGEASVTNVQDNGNPWIEKSNLQGKKYWVHRDTNQISDTHPAWEPPTATIPAPVVLAPPVASLSSMSINHHEIPGTKVDPSKPDEWKATLDHSTGRTYYYNRRSRVTTWEEPETLKWKEAVDPQSGRTYWYNVHTNETTWKDKKKCQKWTHPPASRL